jgi:hypothetical protein
VPCNGCNRGWDRWQNAKSAQDQCRSITASVSQCGVSAAARSGWPTPACHPSWITSSCQTADMVECHLPSRQCLPMHMQDEHTLSGVLPPGDMPLALQLIPAGHTRPGGHAHRAPAGRHAQHAQCQLPRWSTALYLSHAHSDWHSTY